MKRIRAHPVLPCEALTLERDWESEGDVWTVGLDGLPIGLVVRRRYAPGRGSWFWSVMLPFDLPSSLYGDAADLEEAVTGFEVAWIMLRDYLSEDDYSLVMKYLREAAARAGRPRWWADPG